jgi:mRNA interferase MazF
LKPGNIVLIRLAQAGGGPPKLRPALIICSLPGPYQNLLLCGVSTQIHLLEPDWDELIAPQDLDFTQSGLRQQSAARLSYLYSASRSEFLGSIGHVDPSRLNRLRSRLAKRLSS